MPVLATAAGTGNAAKSAVPAGAEWSRPQGYLA
jgi:hypothetical protein